MLLPGIYGYWVTLSIQGFSVAFLLRLWLQTNMVLSWELVRMQTYSLPPQNQSPSFRKIHK